MKKNKKKAKTEEEEAAELSELKNKVADVIAQNLLTTRIGRAER